MKPREIQELAAEVLLALLGSLDYSRVPPTSKWDRGLAALTTAAGAEDFGRFVETMAVKLQIDVMRISTVNSICSLERRVGEVGFEAFRTEIEQVTRWIVALARMRHEQQKEEQNDQPGF